MCTNESRQPCGEACSRCRRTATSRLASRDCGEAVSHRHMQAHGCTDTARTDGRICGRALLMQVCTSSPQLNWPGCAVQIQKSRIPAECQQTARLSQSHCLARRDRSQPSSPSRRADVRAKAGLHLRTPSLMCQHMLCRSRRAGGLTCGRTWPSCRGPTAQPQVVRPS